VRNQNWEKRRPHWIRVVIALSLVIFLIILTALLSGCGICSLLTESAIIIENRSGSNVRFEEVTIDGQIVWAGHDVIIRTKGNLEKPYLDTTPASIMIHFRAPKRILELKLTVVTLMLERETVSCALDNRPRPCIFAAHYVKGKLHCGECEDYMD